jgi:hypothetical protein
LLDPTTLERKYSERRPAGKNKVCPSKHRQ